MTATRVNWSDFLELNPISIAMYTPGEPGIYRLSYLDTVTRARHVFLVGQADDLRQSLKALFLKKGVNQCVADKMSRERCYFRYAVLHDEAERLGALRSMYDRFMPECNDPQSIPDVAPLPINVD